MDPNLNSDFDAYLRQLIAEETAKQGAGQSGAGATGATGQVDPTTGAPVAASANKPINLTIGGKQYAFPDEGALSKALEQTFTENQAALEAARQEQQRAAHPQGQAGSYVGAGEAAPVFSQEKYIELMGNNAIKAQEYLDSFRYGFEGRVENPSQVLGALLQESVATQRQLAAYQFKDAHADVFQANPQNAQTLDKIRAELNLPFTLKGLETALAVGQQRGIFPYAQQQQQQQVQQQQQPGQFQGPPQPQAPPNSFLQPQPSFQAPAPNFQDPRAWNGGMGGNMVPAGPPAGAINRGAAQNLSPDIVSAAQNMSSDQLESLMARLGMLPGR